MTEIEKTKDELEEKLNQMLFDNEDEIDFKRLNKEDMLKLKELAEAPPNQPDEEPEYEDLTGEQLLDLLGLEVKVSGPAGAPIPRANVSVTRKKEKEESVPTSEEE